MKMVPESVVFVLAIAIAGCGGASPNLPEGPPTSYQNLGAINAAYVKATQTLGRPPRGREELVRFLQDVGDAAKILRSPDDGEDYVILWNVPPRQIGTIVAYEKRGKDGK